MLSTTIKSSENFNIIGVKRMFRNHRAGKKKNLTL